MPHAAGRFRIGSGKKKVERPRGKSACPCPDVPGVDGSETSDSEAVAPQRARAPASAAGTAVRVASAAPALRPLQDEVALGGECASLLDQMIQFAVATGHAVLADVRKLIAGLPIPYVYKVLNVPPVRAYDFYVNETQLAPGVYHRVHVFHHARSVRLLFDVHAVDAVVASTGRVARAHLDARVPRLECDGICVEVAVHKHNIEAKVGKISLGLYSHHLVTVNGAAVVLLAHEKLMLVDDGVLIEAEHVRN